MTAKRQIFFDTETTGLDPKAGHRVCQFAGVEVVDDAPTGRVLNLFFNPDREIDPEASEVNGLTWDMLKDKPRFRDCVDELVKFIDGAELIAHSSGFDADMIQSELTRINYDRTIWEISEKITDTVRLAMRILAKEKGKGKPLKDFKLDSLIVYFGGDLASRGKHDALKDVELLIPVYQGLVSRVDMSRPSLEEDVPRAPVVPVNRDQVASLPRIEVSADVEARHVGYLEEMAAKEKVDVIGLRPKSAAPRP